MKGKKIIGVIVGLLAIGVVAFLLLHKTTYQVEFDTDGGTDVEIQMVKKGEKATKPSDPLKDDYDFVTWVLDGEEYDFDTPVTSDLVIYAKWEKSKPTNQYKVTIMVDGKKKELTTSALKEDEIEKLFPPKTGYEFKLYANGKEYDINTPLTGDVELTGKYVQVANYTVTFNSDGGTAVAKQSIVPGESAKEPTAPTKEAYIFDGWYLGNTKYDFSQKVTKSITLVAKWKEDPNVKRYEVTFDSDGGSAVAKQRIIENKTAVVPKNPTKQGYQFVEWQLDGTKFDFKTKITKDITLKAKWKEVITYTVTFDSNGGSSVASQSVIEGNKASKPKDPTKDGYNFKEWQLNGTAYNFSNAVTGNITLVAVWTEKPVTYTVTFNSNGGSNVATQTVNKGSTATKPANPTRNGYDFKEWQLDGVTYVFSTPVTSNITLTAVWTEKVNYTVRITKVDNYSPDSRLTVYKNGTQISYSAIKFTDGTPIPGGVTKTSNLQGETAFIVVLTSGEEVTATVVQ